MLDMLKKLWTGKVKTDSESGKVDGKDGFLMLRNAVIIGVVATLTHVMGNVGDTEWGTYAPIVVVIGGFVVDFITKLKVDNKKV